MISKELAEACAKIEKFQKDFPGCYASVKGDVEKAKLVMCTLVARLDAKPPIESPMERAEQLNIIAGDAARLRVAEQLIREVLATQPEHKVKLSDALAFTMGVRAELKRQAAELITAADTACTKQVSDDEWAPLPDKLPDRLKNAKG